MIVYEFKLKQLNNSFDLIDQYIRLGQYIRNKSLRFWQDNINSKINQNDLRNNSLTLEQNAEFSFNKLHSHAIQASSEVAWFAIKNFYEKCKNPKIKNKGFPRYKKFSRSIKYKNGGWKLSDCKKYLLITNYSNILAKFKLIGTRDLHFYTKNQFSNLILIRRCDGYYAQFVIKYDRKQETFGNTNCEIGIDLGLKSFYTDSNSDIIPIPKKYRKREKRLKHLQRKVSKKQKRSNNRKKAVKKLAKQHLKVSRQRKDFVIKLAKYVTKSNDLVVLEKLNILGIIKNHKLAKSIQDASWGMFKQWLEYFSKIHNCKIEYVNAHYTSKICSKCGYVNTELKLSDRIYDCKNCDLVLDRDYNAAINILKRYKNTVGNTEIQACGENVRLNNNSNIVNKQYSKKQESSDLLVGISK